MKAPTPARRRRARIDTPWQPGCYVDESGNAAAPQWCRPHIDAARATAELLQRHIEYARNPDAAPSYVKPAQRGRTININVTNLARAWPDGLSMDAAIREALRNTPDFPPMPRNLYRPRNPLDLPPVTAEEIERARRRAIDRMRRNLGWPPLDDPDQ